MSKKSFKLLNRNEKWLKLKIKCEKSSDVKPKPNIYYVSTVMAGPCDGPLISPEKSV